MSLNPFFLQGSPNEQFLVQDLINEQLKIYGVEIYYLPRKIFKTDDIIREIQSSKFDDVFMLEAYINNYDGYAPDSDIMTKFGLRLKNEISLTISKERYEEFIAPFLEGISSGIREGRITDYDFADLITRPKEGDLIYFPLGERLFEIKRVEVEKPFYQLGSNYIYELSCELYEYENELVDTSIEEVDNTVEDEGYITSLTLVGSAVTATATASIATGAINEIFLNNDGSGYTSAPTITFSDPPNIAGGDIAATAVAITTSRANVRSILRIEITNGGSGYTTPPTILISGGGGTGAAATCSIGTTSVNTLTLTNSGNGYATVPTITFLRPDNLGATATATVGAGGTISALLTNPGVGYTANPPVTIDGPPTRTGVIDTISIDSTGDGYSVGQYQLEPFSTVAENDPGNSALINVTAVDGSNRISAVSVEYGGADYTGGGGHRYHLVGIITATTIANNLVGATGLTTVTTVSSGGNDDGFFEVDIPFNINYHGQTYTKVYVGTNNYLTFGSGSASLNNFSKTSPTLHKIMMQAGDNSVQRIFHGAVGTTPNRTFIVRSEGTNNTSGILGSPNMVYEATFYEAIPGQIDIQIGTMARTDGFSGAYSRRSLRDMGNLDTPNSGTRLTSSVGGDDSGNIDIETVTTGIGTTAVATAIIGAGGTISALTITNPGSGYTVAPTIEISNDDEFGSIGVGASAIALITADKKIGELRILKGGTEFTQTPGIQFSGFATVGVGTFIYNEIVTGQSSGTTGRVRDFRTDISAIPGVAPVTNLRVSLNTGKFNKGEIVVGSISSARYVVEDYSTDSYDNPYDVNEEIETEADDILDFTESNPFGSY